MSDLPSSGAATSAMLAAYEAQAKKIGVTVAMLRVLEAVALHPGCSQKTLCGLLGLAKQRVHLLTRTLEERRLLFFTKDETDGRSKLLFVTEEGKAATEGLLAVTQPHGGAAEQLHTHVLEDGTVVTHCHGDGLGHTHSHQHTKAVLDRLARSIGHLEKVRQMVEDGVDCSEVLIQLSAVKAAINSTGKLILKDHIGHCLVDAVEHGDSRTIEELNRAIDQFIK